MRRTTVGLLLVVCLLACAARVSARPITDEDLDKWWNGTGSLYIRGTGDWLFWGNGYLSVSGAGFISLDKGARYKVDGYGWVQTQDEERIQYTGKGTVVIDMRGTVVGVNAMKTTTVEAEAQGSFYLNTRTEGVIRVCGSASNVDTGDPAQPTEGSDPNESPVTGTGDDSIVDPLPGVTTDM